MALTPKEKAAIDKQRQEKPAFKRWYPEELLAEELLLGSPCMDAVWKTLELDTTLTTFGKNALWQDFVAAWNRRGLLTNEEAEAMIKKRF